VGDGEARPLTVARGREKPPLGQLEGLPLREELEALVRHYHHLQNEHKRAPVESAPRRHIENRLLDVRSRFDRLLEEWVPEPDLRRAWVEHLHSRAPMPDGPPGARPLVYAGVAEVTGSRLEIRGESGEELEARIDGALVERLAGQRDVATTTAPLRFRLDGVRYTEIFASPAEALQALDGFLEDELQPPPWDFARELLADGIVDTNFALTTRGRRALASRAP
jgi:hypothetical protein